MTALALLSFVAAIVLHKYEEPNVIGKLSKDDVAEISKLTLNSLRAPLRAELRYELTHGDVIYFVLHAKRCALMKVITIEMADSGKATAHLGTGTNELAQFYVEKIGNSWTLRGAPFGSNRISSFQITNSSPVTH